jgi:tetratricopeptide (TPR) repeat protein
LPSAPPPLPSVPPPLPSVPPPLPANVVPPSLSSAPPPLPANTAPVPPPLPANAAPPPLPQTKLPKEYYFLAEKDLLFTDKTEADLVVSKADAIIEQTPQNAGDYSLRGKAYAYKGEYDMAIADYIKALEMENNLYSTFANYTFSYYYKNDIDGLAGKADELIKMEPDLIYGYIARAYALTKRNEHDKAINEWTRIIQQNPPGCEYWYMWRGRSYYNKEDYQKAIDDYSKMIEIKRDIHSAFYWRAMSYLKFVTPKNNKTPKFMKSLKMAVADLAEAVLLAPENTDYAKLLAMYNKVLLQVI